jgi:hypothetical protein
MGRKEGRRQRKREGGREGGKKLGCLVGVEGSRHIHYPTTIHLIFLPPAGGFGGDVSSPSHTTPGPLKFFSPLLDMKPCLHVQK